jgi:hypothetical protein
MGTERVAFTSENGPQLIKGEDAGFPGVGYIYRWVVWFSILRPNGDSKKISPVSGFVVQGVTGSKKVFKPDGALEEERSADESLWEAFKVTDGRSEGTDTIQLVFAMGYKTTLTLTLAAGFQPTVAGTAITTLDPMATPGGADCKLSNQPENFAPTLIRKIRILADCRGSIQWFRWKTLAQNHPGTYRETWEQIAGQQISH